MSKLPKLKNWAILCTFWGKNSWNFNFFLYTSMCQNSILNLSVRNSGTEISAGCKNFGLEFFRHNFDIMGHQQKKNYPGLFCCYYGPVRWEGRGRVILAEQGRPCLLVATIRAGSIYFSVDALFQCSGSLYAQVKPGLTKYLLQGAK